MQVSIKLLFQVRLANLRTGGYELTGIISFGMNRCGDNKFPLVFTR